MAKPYTSDEIRQIFLDYFAQRGHTIVPSASLVPQDDPTLLFTNAGMNQFKDVFLNTGSRPYTRAADTQKCMRVAGKHNDLDDVGRDGTHHTLFEMLGNWSFGDYYKKEAITWAWDLLTRVYGLPKEQLWVTVFKDDQGDLGRDEETAHYWRTQTHINPEHILFFGRKDNFWEMGDTGPCGPCSEIHLDRGAAACDKQKEPGHVCAVNGTCARFIELWNLVFIQYNRYADGSLEPLPARHVDTGMGFERLTAVLQNKLSNYRTDLFWPLIQQTQQMAGQTDEEREAHIIAYRVIADHIRAVTFLVGDGVLPANEGRGYVLRMVLRRAVRFGRHLGFTQPFMANLAEQVIQMMGHVFPELPQRAKFIKATITAEEERFLHTLDRGLARMDEMIATAQKQHQTIISGEDAFFLHDTLGLPLEVTRDIAAEHGIMVDIAGYHTAREAQRARARAAGEFQMEADEHALLYPTLYEWLKSQTTQLGYDPYKGTRVEHTHVVGIIRDDTINGKAEAGDKVELVLEHTCFYVESGGQVSDTGRIYGNGWEVIVEDVLRPLEGMIVHLGHMVRGELRLGEPATAEVDAARRWDIMRNHTATHLLHKALRQVLGSHVAQAGSRVEPNRLRFDYNHDRPLQAEERTAVERIVTQAILANYEVQAREENYRDALAQGVIALFGEKYGNVVRVLRIGDPPHPFSQELCGGTHVQRTGDIGSFLIVSESGIGSGVRRIEAMTGRGALQAVQSLRARQEEAASKLNCAPDEVTQHIARLQAELKATQKEVEQLTQKLARVEFQSLLDKIVQVKDVPVLAAQVNVPDSDSLREMADWFRDVQPGGVIILGTIVNGKPQLIAATTKATAQERHIHAGQLVKQVAQIVGGGGGGRPEMGQAGGRYADKLAAAITQAPKLLEAMLS